MNVPTEYDLDAQIGFLMRRANQRHLAIFATHIADVTPMQFAVLARLAQKGAMSQNALGRAVAMDAATIKGVVDRLRARDLIKGEPDDRDRRRVTLQISDAGQALFDRCVAPAFGISARTLDPLNDAEQKVLLGLLARLG